MSNKRKLSVLICAHCPDENYDKMLIRAIDSLCTQTYTNFNLYIVLDECWQKTHSTVKNYIKMNMPYHRVDFNTEVIVKNKKEGLAKAKNAGLSKINTEYVAFLDADDWYIENKLEKQINFMEENKDIDFLGTLAVCNDLRSGVPKIIPSCFDIGQYETHEQISNRIFKECVMTHGSLFIRKHALDDLGGYNDVTGTEDWDLWKRAIDSGYKFHQLQERLYMLTLGTSVPR